MLRKLLTDHRPEYIAASFDLPGPTFRAELAADYKANRAPMPPDLAEQVPLVHRACEALGVPMLTYAGFEADDVIGTLAVGAPPPGYTVAIITGDKDFFQLVGDARPRLQPARRGNLVRRGRRGREVRRHPGQVVDMLALMGDAIDNVKGVPGIGEKGARELIAAVRHARRAARARRAVPQSATAKRCWPTRTRHATAGNCCASAPTCRCPRSTSRHSGRGRRARDVLRALLGAGFRSLVAEFAPTDRRHRRRRLRGSVGHARTILSSRHRA